MKQIELVVSIHLKNMLVKLDHFPSSGETKKCLSCHHLVMLPKGESDPIFLCFSSCVQTPRHRHLVSFSNHGGGGVDATQLVSLDFVDFFGLVCGKGNEKPL